MLIVFSLAMGGFGIGTGEFAIMGLMPSVAQDLGVTEPQVGHLISAYALGVVVGAPVLAIIGARFYRRHLLIALMGFYALGNLASALALWLIADFPVHRGIATRRLFRSCGIGGCLSGSGQPACQSC